MYIYVIISGKDDYFKTGPGSGHGRIKACLEQISGERCLNVPTEQFCPETIAELNPRAIVVSGYSKPLEDFKVASFYGLNDVLHQADIPAIGLCGGHQLFAYFFNGGIREMARLEDQRFSSIPKPMRIPFLTGHVIGKLCKDNREVLA